MTDKSDLQRGKIIGPLVTGALITRCGGLSGVSRGTDSKPMLTWQVQRKTNYLRPQFRTDGQADVD